MTPDSLREAWARVRDELRKDVDAKVAALSREDLATIVTYFYETGLRLQLAGVSEPTYADFTTQVDAAWWRAQDRQETPK